MAVFTAAWSTIAIFFLAVAATSGDPFAAGHELILIVMIAIVLTGTFALPGFILTLVGAYYFQQSSGTYFCICGVLTAGLALALFSGLTAIPTMWYVFLGGAAGGLAYAWFHQRFLSLPAPSKS
ncbi:MAG: hypothetical protein AAFR27_04315 [Pseudomonadota bacterium]